MAMLNALNQDLAVLLDGKRLILDMHWLRKWLNIFSHFRLHCIADVSCWLQTKKFDGSVLLLKRDKKATITGVHNNWTTFWARKKGLKVNPLGEIANQTNPQRIESLKEQYWITDEDSPFAQRDIRFTLVLDEEHEAYRIFQQNVCQTLMNDDQQLPSLLAILHRVLEYVDECSSDERAPVYPSEKLCR